MLADLNGFVSSARALTNTTFRRLSGKSLGVASSHSAYTPYQPEASQGTLQVLYEYQSMMAGLTGMAVSNASLYDGGLALAGALLMAVRANRKSKSKRILVPRTLHPHYRRAAHAIIHNQGWQLVELPYDPTGGQTPEAALAPYAGQDFAALVIPQPTFWGCWRSLRADRLGAPAKRAGGGGGQPDRAGNSHPAWPAWALPERTSRAATASRGRAAQFRLARLRVPASSAGAGDTRRAGWRHETSIWMASPALP